MPFDPSSSFSVIDEGAPPSSTAEGFDPSKDFSVVDEPSGFDPAKDFKVVDEPKTGVISRGLAAFGEAMAKQSLPTSGVPAVTVPRVGEPGTATRGVSEAVSSLIEGATTPEGIAAGGLIPVPGVGKAVAAALTMAAVKPLAQLAGEASVTHSPETIAQAATLAGAAGIGAYLSRTPASDTPLTRAALEQQVAGAAEPKVTEGLPTAERQATQATVEQSSPASVNLWQHQAEIRRNAEGDFEWIENGNILDTSRDPLQLVRAFHEDNAGYSTRVTQTSPDHFQMDLAEPSEGKEPIHELIPYDPRAKMREQISATSRGLPTAEATIANPSISEGPGAASPGDIPKSSQIVQLTEAIKPTEPVARPLGSQIASEVSRAYEQIKGKAETTLDNLKALGSQAMDALRGEQPWTDFKSALGKFSGESNRNSYELQKFAAEMRRAVPDPVRREAVVNWIQADGDPSVIAGRAAASKAPHRAGYETAASLTPDEITLAANTRSYLDAKLQEGIDAGLLNEGVENYVTQLWDRPNPIANKLIGEAVSGKLAPNFKFARQRIFDSYFEGEQAGYKPKVKDIGALISIYDQSFSRAIASRKLIKSLHEGTASDGRPLVEVSGVSNLLSESGSPEALLIKPRAKPEDLAGYLPLDHPALRGWKWAGTDPESGAPILYQGDMLVHPEIHAHLKNVLSTSALRQNVFFRSILKGQSILKQSKLSLSGFHFTQEGAHAASHRVNPFAPDTIDFSSPVQSALVDHGLQVADYRAYQAFAEGLSGAGGLYERIPGVGKWLTRYNEYLFQEYIPRLKMTMAMDALDRNRNRFAGKLSDDQILELTANQSNAAFGELNYTMLGRNPTFQDFFRLAALAPDFLEARFRFAAQALTKTGTEQRVALALQAATLYTAARVLNQALDGDPHWEPKYAFDVVVNKRQYGIRSVVEDTAHLISNPAQFISNRLAPFAKTAVEFTTGRDWRGIKRSSLDQLTDLASWLVPITVGRQANQTKLDTALSASGVTVRSATAQQRLFDKLQSFKTDKGLLTKEEKAGMTGASEYGPLRTAINNNNESGARAEYDALLHPNDGTKPKTPAQIREHFINAVSAPVGGNRRVEMQFLKSLDKTGMDLYLEARKERKDTALKFGDLQRKWMTEEKTKP